MSLSWVAIPIPYFPSFLPPFSIFWWGQCPPLNTPLIQVITIKIHFPVPYNYLTVDQHQGSRSQASDPIWYIQKSKILLWFYDLKTFGLTLKIAIFYRVGRISVRWTIRFHSGWFHRIHILKLYRISGNVIVPSRVILICLVQPKYMLHMLVLVATKLSARPSIY